MPESGRTVPATSGIVSRQFGRGGALLAATLALFAVFVSVPLTPALAASPPVVAPNQTSPGNTLQPTFGWSVDVGAVAECRVSVAGSSPIILVGPDWTACGISPYVADLTGQPDGTYTVEVKATDGLGSAVTAVDYVLDTTVPTLPTITVPPATPSNSSGPSWAFTLPEGTGECRILRGPITIVDWTTPCASPYVADLTGQVDGTYTFEVRAVDAATNRGPAASSDYVLDTALPGAPTVATVTSSPGNNTNPNFSFTGEALSTAHCRVVQGATEIIAVTTCTSPHSVNLASQLDGTYTLEVYVTDQAGNDGPTGSSSYVLDRVAPGTPSIDSGPGALGKDTTPTWAFSGEAGATFRCQVDGPTSTGTFAVCTSPYTPTLSQGDGSYSLHVTATDAAGNPSGTATAAYTLDTTAPVVSSLSGPASPGTDTTPTFTFTTEPTASTECRVDGPTGAGTYAPCTSPYTPTLSAGDGNYIVRVRATDLAGNTGVAATQGYDLDTTGPVAAVVSGPAGPSANTSVSWSFTAESGATTECRLVGPTSTSGWTSCTSPEPRTLSQGDGTYTLQVRATDPLGNLGAVGSASPGYLLDTSAPGAVSVTAPASPSNDPTIAFSFTTEAGATVQCRLVGPTSTSAWAPCTSPSPVSLSQGDGTYTFEAQATDLAGNIGPVGAANYVLDTQAPNAPTVSGPSSPGNSAAVSFSFTAEAGATLECRLDGPSGTGTYATCSSPDLLTLSQGDGSYVFRVRAVDVAGNTGSAASKVYQLDTAAPAAPSVSGPASPGNSTTATFTFTAEAGSSTTCRLTGPLTVGTWAPCVSPELVSLSQGQGTYTYEVKATDAAGNTGAVGSASYVLDTTPPAAPAVSGSTGPSNVASVTWTFTTDPQTTTECRRLHDGSPITGWTGCTSPQTPALASGDGTYTLQVRATDLAANTGPVGVSPGYVLDTTGPAAPTMTSTPATPSTSRSPGWAFTLPEGSGQCRLVRGPTVIVNWVGCTSPKAYDLTGLVDGTYSFEVRAIDAATNPGAIATDDYVLDTTAPVAPVVTTVTATPGTTTTPSFSFAGEALSNAHCRVLQDGTQILGFAPCSSPDVIDVTGRPDATYTVEVYVTDLAGNDGPPASSDYVLDRAAPGTPSIDAGPGALGKDTTPTWAFSGEAGATFRCKVDGPTSTGSFAVCTSPYTPTLSQGDGGYQFSVTATDAAGNISGTATAAYSLDTTAPVAPSLSGPATPGSDTTPTFTFTTEASATTQCRVDGPLGNGTYAACSSPYTPTLSAGDGNYVIRVRATDQAANTGVAATSGYTLDTTAPAAPTVSGPTGPSPVTTVSWTFTAEAGATTECRLVGPTSTSGWAGCTSPVSQTLGQGDGVYTFGVRATDPAGNVGPVGSSPAYTLDSAAPAPPTVTTPASPSNATTIVVTFVAEAGSTTKCRTVGPVSTTAWVSCTSPRSLTLSQGDGTYSFEVQATDPALNVSAVGSASYLLDTVAPAAPTVSGPVTPGNSASVSFSFTAEAGASTQCRLDGPLGIGTYAPCTSPDARTLGPDGVYALRVRATDPAGNTSLVGSRVYRLDTAAPAAPAVSGPSSPGTATNVTFTFTAEAGAATNCRLIGPGGIGAWASCVSPDVLTLSQGEGTYTYEVTATDAAGNTGPAGSATYVLDQTAPGPPVVSGPTGPSNVASATWTFTTDPQTTTECRRLRNGTPLGGWVSCTSPRTSALGSGDGSYTLEVRATDLAGNTGPVGVSPAYVLDTAAPAAPSLAGPSSPGNASSADFVFTAETGALTDCQLSGPVSTSAWAPCTSPATRALSQGDGTYTFRVRATDAATNTGPAASVGYLLDTAPPTAPAFTVLPGSPGKTRSPSWSFTLPSDGTGQCQLTRGAVIVDPWTACSSPHVADLTTQPDGTYTLSVRAVDAAGNTSGTAGSAYLLDTTPPTVTTVNPPSGTTSNDTTPAWTFTTEAGATTECQVLKGLTTIVARAACASPVTADLTATGDGTYTLQIWVTDVAGNTGAPAIVTYMLDTLPPAAPAITGTPAPVSSTRSPTWTFTAESGATTQCRLTKDGAVPGAFSACTSPYVADLTGKPDGTYDFEVEAIDAAGNSGPASTNGYVLDTTAPTAPTLVSSPGSPSKLRTPAWGFTTEPGATTACRVDGPLGVVSALAACTSPFTADLTGQPDGVYTFSVYATDVANNTGPPLVVTYVLDSTAPITPTILTAPTGPSPNRAPTWTFTGEPGATFTCAVNLGAVVVASPTPCLTSFTGALAGRPDGTYLFSVVATDVSGNTSAATTATYILDTVAPASPRFTRKPASPATSRRPSWSWTGDPKATPSCRLTRGSVTVVNWRTCASPYVADLSGQPNGSFTLAVRLTDVAGNVGTPATSAYVLDTVAPAAPTFTIRPPSPGGDKTPTFAWTGEPGAKATCLVTRSGRVIRDWAACAAPLTPNLNGLPDGSYVIAVRMSDAAGNNGPAAKSTYVLDTVTPPPPSGGGTGNGGGGGGGTPPPPPAPAPGPGTTVIPPPRTTDGRPGGIPPATRTQPPLKTGAKGPEATTSRPLFSPQLPPVGDVPNVIGQVAVKSLEKPQFPLLLLVVVAVFLLVQNRIDRKDPKLATAPVDAEPMLGFGPAVETP